MPETTTNANTTFTAGQQTPKQQLLDSFKQEHEITMRVLRSYPAAQSELSPHPRSKSARELAWMFTLELGLLQAALRNQLSFPPRPLPPAPENWDAVVGAYEGAQRDFVGLLEATPDGDLFSTMTFPSGPGKLSEIPKIQLMWFMLCDSIHHRGQLSVYLRMTGSRVPSIYGPSGDEPWF
jgi:uncharacterized damage-inducible protein DinB